MEGQEGAQDEDERGATRFCSGTVVSAASKPLVPAQQPPFAPMRGLKEFAYYQPRNQCMVWTGLGAEDTLKVQVQCNARTDAMQYIRALHSTLVMNCTMALIMFASNHHLHPGSLRIDEFSWSDWPSDYTLSPCPNTT